MSSIHNDPFRNLPETAPAFSLVLPEIEQHYRRIHVRWVSGANPRLTWTFRCLPGIFRDIEDKTPEDESQNNQIQTALAL